jgi:predicted transcriptional regulator
MLKYIQITTGDGVELIAADAILYAASESSTAAKIHTKDGNHIAVVGVALTSGFAEALHAALEEAAIKSWQNPIAVVALPSGTTVTSLTVAAGV